MRLSCVLSSSIFKVDEILLILSNDLFDKINQQPYIPFKFLYKFLNSFLKNVLI